MQVNQMGLMSRMEDGMENVFEGGAQAVFKASLNPVQITKRAVKEMNRNKLVGSGRQYAPTLYNVLVSETDDQKLGGYYPTLAREIETVLVGKAQEHGLEMDGQPLVRFIVDDTLKKGKFDIIAESVAAPIVKKLRQEEMLRYGMIPERTRHEQPAAGGAMGVAPVGVKPIEQRRGALAVDPFEPQGAAFDDEFVPAAGNAGAAGFGGAGVGALPVINDADDDDVPGAFTGDSPDGYEQDYYDQPAIAAGRASVPQRDIPAAALIDISTGDTYLVKGHEVMLGREDDCDVRILDANVSRHHAAFVFENGRWTIEDLGSTNGTSVNHRRISRTVLADGDILVVGVTKLKFQAR